MQATSDLARLAGEALGEGGDDGIMLGGHHRGHVEGVANKHTSGLEILAPIWRPELRSNGATPTSEATWRRVRDPSSGSRAIRVAARTGPTAGTLRSRSLSSARSSCSAISSTRQRSSLASVLSIDALRAVTRRRSRPSRRCSSWLMQSRMASWVWRRTSRCSARRSRRGIAPELVLLRVGAGELGDGAGIEAIGLGQPALQLGKAAHRSGLSR